MTTQYSTAIKTQATNYISDMIDNTKSLAHHRQTTRKAKLTKHLLEIGQVSPILYDLGIITEYVRIMAQ